MNIPTKNQLLQELDAISHAGRVRRMALLGRDAAGTKQLNNLLDELQGGDTYEQMLGLFASIAARDGNRVLTILQSESVLLRNYAAPACWAVTDDEALAAVVLKAAPDTRKRLIKAIAKQRRTALAEKLFPEIRAKFGADLAVLLLSACTSATVARALAEDSHALKNWQWLAIRYPDIVLQNLQQTFEAAPQRTYQSLWQHFDSAWKPLTLLRPKKVLELVQAFTSVSSESSSRYQRDYWFSRAFNTDELGIPSQVLEILTKRLPDGVFNLLTQARYHEKLQNSGLPTPVLKFFRFFSPEQQVTFLRLVNEDPGEVAEALAKLPPSVRAERFTAAYADVDTQHTVWSETLLETLPHAERAQLAQHQLTLREIREDPERQLTMIAYDDIDNARPILEKAATSAQAEERGRALALLVSCTGRYRRGLTATLTFLQRLKNEQDPVRSDAWTALAEVPPSLFKAEHIELLQQLVDFSMEARDTSLATRYKIEDLAFTLLCVNAKEPKSELFTAALEIIRQLAQKSGSLRLPSLSSKLPRGTEYAIVEALMPLIQAFEQHEQYSLLLRLVESLGKRGRYIAELQKSLEIVVHAKPDYLAKHAINLWLKPFKTRDARVRQLLDKDPSVIRIDKVFQHLHRHRQEWLDPFFTKKPIKGQFLSGKTLYLLPAQDGFQRWLPRQQQTFTKLLHIVANDENAQHRVQAIHTLARLPTNNTATFESYLNSEEVVINEAALGALGWIDHPHTALPILLQHLEGDRARVAMYAVPRCARLVEPEKLVSVLQELLARDKLRVTVHKEAIRLLGTHATPASLPLLHEQWQRPSVHRDVQIAIGHAARNLLNHEQAWELIEKLAKTEDTDIVRSLFAQQPTALPQAARVRYAKLLLNMTTHPDVRVRREVFTALKAWTVGAEEEIAAAAATSIINLQDSPEWQYAWTVLLTCCRDGLAAERLYEVVQSLINAPVTDSNNATPERDLPARQRLFVFCKGLCKLPESNRLLLRPTLDKLASLCLQDASLWSSATLLYIAGLPWATPAKCANRLMQLAQEASTQPIFVQALCKAVRKNLQRCETAIEMTAALELVDTLVASQSDISTLLALEILRYIGSRSHWVEDCAQRLRSLRQHNSVGVRAIACKIWTNEE